METALAGCGKTPKSVVCKATKEGQGLCPWTPAKAEPLQSNYLVDGVWGLSAPSCEQHARHASSVLFARQHDGSRAEHWPSFFSRLLAFVFRAYRNPSGWRDRNPLTRSWSRKRFRSSAICSLRFLFQSAVQAFWRPGPNPGRSFCCAK